MRPTHHAEGYQKTPMLSAEPGVHSPAHFLGEFLETVN